MRLSSSHAASTNTSSSFRSGNKLFFAWSRRSRLSSTAVVYPILMVLAVVFAVTRWTRTAELTPNSTSYSWDHDNESKNSNHRSPPRLPATCKGKEKIWETLNRAIQNAVTDKGDPDGCSLSTTTLKIANTRTLRRHSRSSSSSSRKSINRKSQPFRKTPLSNQRSEYSRMHSSRSQTLTKTNKNRRQQQHTYGVTTCNVTDLCDQLPQLKQVVSLYGATPVVLGLETCAPYRALVAAAVAKSTPVPVAHSFSNETVVPFVATSPRPVIRVAGLYNSGTNALTAALADNHFPHSFDYGNEYVDGTSRTNGSLWEVPWGKHVPPTKGRREASSSSDVEPALVPLVLPIVIVRDPFRWMSSMVRTSKRRALFRCVTFNGLTCF